MKYSNELAYLSFFVFNLFAQLNSGNEKSVFLQILIGLIMGAISSGIYYHLLKSKKRIEAWLWGLLWPIYLLYKLLTYLFVGFMWVIDLFNKSANKHTSFSSKNNGPTKTRGNEDELEKEIIDLEKKYEFACIESGANSITAKAYADLISQKKRLLASNKSGR